MRTVDQRNDPCHNCPFVMYKLDQDYWMLERKQLSGSHAESWKGVERAGGVLSLFIF